MKIAQLSSKKVSEILVGILFVLVSAYRKNTITTINYITTKSKDKTWLTSSLSLQTTLST
jgi:hypothetical protein